MCTSEYQAVRNATGMVAAASSETPSGTGVNTCASAVQWVAKLSRANPITASPGCKLVTPGPTRSTRPAHSKPNTAPASPSSSTSSSSRPFASMTSRKFRPDAEISTSTSPGSGARRVASIQSNRAWAPCALSFSRAAGTGDAAFMLG